MPVPSMSHLLAAFDGCPDDGPVAPLPPQILTKDFDTMSADVWQVELSATLTAVGGWHARPSRADAELVRHGLTHLRHGDSPLADRLARCVTAAGPYFVPGVGWRFWAAAVHGLDPDRLPHWCPDVLAGCIRLGAAGDRASDDLAGSFAAVTAVYESVVRLRPEVTAGRLDRFFRAVSRSVGREPGPNSPDLDDRDRKLRHELRAMRAEVQVRSRAHRTPPPADEAALLHEMATAAGEPPVVPISATNWLSLVDRIDRPERLAETLRDSPWLAGDGLWLVTGTLHRQHPKRFPPWSTAVANGLAALDDAVVPGLAPVEQYRLLVGVAGELRERYRVHPAEVGELLARLGGRLSTPPVADRFGGFAADTFRFLGELTANNSVGWMATARDRYRYAVRGPLVELCEAVAERYVRPVLGGEYGWELETEPRPGKALSSVCKNDFGQSGPYQPVLWATYYRQPGSKKTAAQLFVRLAADGLSYGFRLSRTARGDGRQFRANVQAHGALLFEALKATGGAVMGFAADHETAGPPVRSAADLREWATNKDLVAGVRLSPADAVSRTEELVGDILLAFDRLVPLFAAAVMDDPRPVLAKRAGRPGGSGFDRTAFRDATLLAEPWLDRALDLLQAKRQLILQGVPGTGKTHVARALARHLTGDRPELVSTVQFHPAYSYEEFVEGIRPKTDGAAVSYLVEPGVLLRVAEQAARHPADPHVLLVDEINRGNLPRVFGELLYLLEYRDQAVTLPYSKAPFRLPPNLFLLATLNPADRSVTPLDQATRRRFAFLDMPPDAAVLSRWLARHPPVDADPDFGGQLVKWFERINQHLTRDFGPHRQIGHAYWLREGLTREAVASVWDHEVRPALAELFVGNTARLDALAPSRALDPVSRRRPIKEVAR